MNIKVLAAFLLVFSIESPASIIVPFINYGGGVNLAITGEIEDGDEEVLKSTIQEIRASGLSIDYVALDSKGGDEEASLNMSYAIKSVNASTVISDGAVCSNSCFVLFSSGNKKIITKKGKVGLRKFDTRISSTNSSKKPLLHLDDLYKFYGVPDEFITNVIDKAQPNKTYWLKKKDKSYFDSEKEINFERMALFNPFENNNNVSGFEYYLNGISYFSGINAPQDYKQAFEYLNLAANENVPEALHKLGVMYYKGIFVDKSYDDAEDYWNRAATLGYYPSLNNLTLTYEDTDAEENIEVNERILQTKMASSDIMAYSARTLGDAYYNGTGVDKSEIVALGYYQLSAELGDAEGQYKLSTMLVRNQKYKEAYLWLNMSCSVGFSDSCRYLKR